MPTNQNAICSSLDYLAWIKQEAGEIAKEEEGVRIFEEVLDLLGLLFHFEDGKHMPNLMAADRYELRRLLNAAIQKRSMEFRKTQGHAGACVDRALDSTVGDSEPVPEMYTRWIPASDLSPYARSTDASTYTHLGCNGVVALDDEGRALKCKFCFKRWNTILAQKGLFPSELSPFGRS